jgi:hypothetical protein
MEPPLRWTKRIGGGLGDRELLLSPQGIWNSILLLIMNFLPTRAIPAKNL